MEPSRRQKAVRYAALDWLRTALDRAVSDEDSTAVLRSEFAEVAETAAAAAIPTLDEDVEARSILGYYHWRRCLAKVNEADYHRAIELYEAVIIAHPEQVPGYLAPVVEERLWVKRHNRAVGLVEAYRSGNRLADLLQAISLFRQVLAAVPEEDQRFGTSLCSLANALSVLSTETREVRTLDEAVGLWQRAAAVVPAHEPAHAGVLLFLSTALLAKFEMTDDLTALDEAIATARQAMREAPVDHPERHDYLEALSTALQHKASRTGDPGALWEAVDVGRASVDATPGDHPDRADNLSSLCNVLRMAYEQTEDPDVLVEAVRAGREAVAATTSDRPVRGGHLSNLGIALRSLAEHFSDRSLMEEAIDVGRRAVDATAPGDPARGVYLANLVGAQLWCFDWSQDPDVLEQAIRAAREAVAAAGPDRVVCLSILGSALHRRFTRTGDLDALAEAIVLFRRAVAAAPGGHPDHRQCLLHLSAALGDSAERTGDRETLLEAISTGRSAVEATPDHPSRGMALSQLATLLMRRFDVSGGLDVIDEAVEIGRQAVRAAPAGHTEHGFVLSNLGAVLQSRFTQTGDRHDLREALDVHRRAVAAIPVTHPHRAVGTSMLALVLDLEFGRGGDPRVLAESIGAHREALALTPVDHPVRSGRLSNLGNALVVDFTRSGEAETLAEGVRMCREAVDTTPEDHADRAMYLSNLAHALDKMFGRTGDVAVFEEAMARCRQVLAITGEGEQHRASALDHLGNLLQSVYERTGETTALVDAVDANRRAVAATPADHPNRGTFLSNLGIAWRLEFMRTGDLTAIETAIEVTRSAAAAIPADHPHRGGCVSSLGSALRLRFDRTGDPADLAEARACFDETWAMGSASTELRTSAADWAADAAIEAGDTEHALVMAERAVAMLGRSTPRRLRRSDRGHRMATMAGLAPTAATAALVAGAAERAVELLEQARGRLITDTLDTRGDLGNLRRLNPGAAVEFAALREAMDALDHAGAGTVGGHHAADRDRLHAEWDRLLTRIRSTPGLSGFLLPPPVRDLRRAAAHGPIVYVVFHPHTSHAVILTDRPDTPVHAIPLPGVGRQDVSAQAVAFHDAVSSTGDPGASTQDRAAAQRRVLEVLAWLWDCVARPVLDHLGHTAPPAGGGQWPRVHWCPVGIVALLPLHAAGHHGAGSTDTVMDRVVSSYTPTARALLHALTSGSPADRTGSTVVVAVPDAPDTAPLSGVTEEKALLRQHIPGATVLPAPGGTTTRAGVLSALATHEIAHFACHGLADRDAPTSGRLLLHDHLSDPLTLADIVALRLGNARLAYLSACSTTDTHPHHADEATHLTAAFHLAGYASVVGTLWPIGDRAATTITRDFYAHLTDNGTAPPDATRAAVALHRATRRHRDAHPGLPTQWATHVHIGC